MLSVHGSSIGVIEQLTPRLAKRYEIKAVSSIRYKPLRLLHMLVSIWRYKNKCEVVLVDTYSTQAFWFAYLIGGFCYILKIPFIPFIHGGNFLKRIQKSKKQCDFLFTKSHINIVPSKFLELHFNNAMYRVKYIPNFVELEKYPFKLRKQIEARILWVRALHKIYNPLMAVEVVNQLRTLGVHLCMVGSDKDGVGSLVSKRIEELKLSDRVKLTGKLSKDEWIELSKDYDIFINTTTIDNMPVSVIEAMALGLPVVSTSVGGIPYLIENKKEGILVGSGNVEEMVNAINELMEKPDYAKELSLNARRMVEDFDWDKVCLKWFEILDNVRFKGTENEITR